MTDGNNLCQLKEALKGLEEKTEWTLQPVEQERYVKIDQCGHFAFLEDVESRNNVASCNSEKGF